MKSERKKLKKAELEKKLQEIEIKCEEEKRKFLEELSAPVKTPWPTYNQNSNV